ncbi:MAG TPA: EAL domain-containing protein, partial [Candidatus Nanopelagicaceae bacterium]|nr:EAL domain-containing protein [Candidatus Nanopelagicaceae bacterium]
MHLELGQPHLRSQDRPTPADLDGVLGPLFEQATTPMVAIGMDHLIQRANAAFCQLVGRSMAELPGTHILDITHPDDRPASRAVIRRSRRGQIVTGLVKRYLQPGGDPVWVRITTSILRDCDDRPVCALTQAENVTAERDLRHRLQQTERLRTALAESNEAMLRATSAAGLWQEACRIAVQHGGLQMAWLGVVGDDGWVAPSAIWGEDDGYLLHLRTSTRADVPEGRGPVGIAARSRHPAVFQDIETEPRFRPWLEPARRVGFRGVACFPLVRAKRVRGMLTVYSDEAQFFDDEALNLLARLAANVEFTWETLDDRAEQARAAHETKALADRFRHLFERTGVASATLTGDLKLTQVNSALAELVGLRAEELVGTTLLDLVPPGERRQLIRHHRELQRHPEKGMARFEHRLLTQSGELRWLLASSTIMPELDSRAAGIFWQAQDITRERRAEEAATRRSGQQAAIAEFGQYALAVRDVGLLLQRASVLLAQHLEVPKASVLRWNSTHDSFRFIAGVGWEPGVVGNALIPGGQRSLAGLTIRSAEAVLVSDFTTEQRFHEGDLQQIYGIRAGLAVPIVAGDRPYGVLEAFTIDRHEFNDDDSHFAQGLAHVLGTAITRQEDDATLQQQAWHDTLTGLPNRVLLLDRIPAALGRARRGDQLAALLSVDLDRLKVVNDSLGHAAGDEVLRTVAQRLQRLIRPSDTIARVGADEFAALAEDLGSSEMAMLMADRLVKAVEAPILVRGQEVVITASVGVRTTATAALDADELVRDADIAMYHAKAAGGRRAVEFTSAMGGIFGDRVKLEADLHRALANHEFVVYYQPVVGLERGQILGAEALLRWDHPERGLVPPADFIPLAEETGIIVDIGAWVLGEACAACARWSRLLPESQPLVSVNLSTRQLLDPKVVEMVAAALRQEPLSPDLLCMEITETALLADSLAAVSALDEIRTLGVQLALDDFGTGYSSVAHL